MKTLTKTLNMHSPKLMEIPGVVGTGQGKTADSPCIKVFVKKLTPELKENIPSTIENFPVIIEETGQFKSL
jgi:hypothetical protein